MAHKILTHYPDHPEDDELACGRYCATVHVKLKYSVCSLEETALFGVLMSDLAKSLEASFCDDVYGNGVSSHVTVTGDTLTGVIECPTGYVSEGDWSERLESEMEEHWDDEGELVMQAGAEHHVWEEIWRCEIVPVYNRACEKVGTERPLSYRNVQLIVKDCDILQN
ncbi:MAG: hypothetical protein LUD72_13790 [Bacteroidales bacterium]|nr:hypothetical protein [Bacteroidales bacterium]